MYMCKYILGLCKWNLTHFKTFEGRFLTTEAFIFKHEN